MSGNNCVTTGLEAYIPDIDQPWNSRKVQHLFKRAGFGLSPVEIESKLSLTPVEVVDLLVNEAMQLPLPDPPFWENWSISDYDDVTDIGEQNIDWIASTFERMWDYGLREKMTLFWTNHFVTELEVYQCPSWLYQYHTILRTHALGNFKAMTLEVGRSAAMLVYLNGVQNTRVQPNENYARELFELFTLGLDNGYTQNDITEAARALTGYNGFTEACAPINFVEVLHDSARKTIFGQTGNYDYEGLHSLLFEERAEEILKILAKPDTHVFVAGYEAIRTMLDKAFTKIYGSKEKWLLRKAELEAGKRWVEVVY